VPVEVDAVAQRGRPGAVRERVRRRAEESRQELRSERAARGALPEHDEQHGAQRYGGEPDQAREPVHRGGNREGDERARRPDGPERAGQRAAGDDREGCGDEAGQHSVAGQHRPARPRRGRSGEHVEQRREGDAGHDAAEHGEDRHQPARVGGRQRPQVADVQAGAARSGDGRERRLDRLRRDAAGGARQPQPVGAGSEQHGALDVGVLDCGPRRRGRSVAADVEGARRRTRQVRHQLS
jgi:hypothetical protein